MPVIDKTEQLQKELSTLQSELDRIVYLLKIADPAGEAARKRESKSLDPKPNLFKVPSSSSVRQTVSEKSKKTRLEKSVSGSIQEKGTTDVTMATESSKKLEIAGQVVDAAERKTTPYTVVKPQWLGDVPNKEAKETQKEAPLDEQESDQFVDYKDRKEVLRSQDAAQTDAKSGIADAAPGLIVRKRKQVEKTNIEETKSSEQSTSSSVGGEFRAEDAVALLLRHKRGYYGSEDEAGQSHGDLHGNQSGKDKKMPKKVIGPERPSFLDTQMDYESWVPPEGKTYLASAYCIFY